MSPAIRVLQLVPPRQTLAAWQRDRHVQIFAELSALRQDLARLKRLSTKVDRCTQCRVWTTITISDDGNYRCRRCVLAPKEETA